MQTKNSDTLKTMAAQVEGGAALWGKIHAIAKSGGSCTLSQADLRTLARWGELAATLAALVGEIDADKKNNSQAVAETLHWHHADLKQPGTERPVWVCDARGNVAGGWYNQILEIWQARYPNAMHSRPTHWAEIQGPAGTTPLNTADSPS